MVARTSRLAAFLSESQFSARLPRLVVMAVVSMAVLAGCASRQTQAPVADMSSGSASVPSTGLYVVKPGDTLYKISQMHNVDVSTLVQLNNITDPGQLRVGQTLRLHGDAPQVAASSGMKSDTGAAAGPAKVTEPAKPSRAGDAKLVSWGWPAEGKVIQGFSANTKGVDIGGKVGDPVVAAASGKVMYAGNGVRGLGNLVLIGHSNSFITAYAHNEKLLVKTGQEVKKGDRIALMGQTDTTSPRLHFEIRRSGTPVNPLAYLPER
ncbi:MAG TPA: peptidase [Pusillimonas sp.]|jgi:lipoprotein NlpD|nr:peptidase [Pusillimonas sp.]HBT33620.1 peptidase [Pusillimonas sp.]HCN72402.1 peptidase [Pusillimonas sp.]HCP76253.1 peptidase [Pusillimonas sp.]|tara:strand:+ start:42496 stop:43290 length:795 start_codon:yes stop_codon:yes gene_type:complete